MAGRSNSHDSRTLHTYICPTCFTTNHLLTLLTTHPIYHLKGRHTYRPRARSAFKYLINKRQSHLASAASLRTCYLGAKGSRMEPAMVPVDRALLSSYRLSIVTIPLSVTVWPYCSLQCKPLLGVPTPKSPLPVGDRRPCLINVTWDHTNVPAKFNLIPSIGFSKCTSVIDGRTDIQTDIQTDRQRYGNNRNNYRNRRNRRMLSAMPPNKYRFKYIEYLTALQWQAVWWCPVITKQLDVSMK